MFMNIIFNKYKEKDFFLLYFFLNNCNIIELKYLKINIVLSALSILQKNFLSFQKLKNMVIFIFKKSIK